MGLPLPPRLYPTPAVPPLRRVPPCLTERSRMSGIALSLREEIRAFSHAVFRRMALACGRIVCVPSVSGVGGLLLVAHRRLCVAVAIKKSQNHGIQVYPHEKGGAPSTSRQSWHQPHCCRQPSCRHRRHAALPISGTPDFYHVAFGRVPVRIVRTMRAAATEA